MTDRKPPPGPPERTIIQPNPGGRRAALPPQPGASSPQPAAGPPAGRESGAVDWAGSFDSAPRPAPASPPPLHPAPRQPGQAMILKRDVPVAPNENLLVEAAGPILLLLGRLRASLMHARFADLMDQVASAIEAFEKSVRAEGVGAETARDATYALAATADDIVQNIPSEDRQIWTQYSMLSRFFGERVGGVRFFELLDRAKADPHANVDLLELMYVCLSIGFQGIHRTAGGGAAALQSIQRNLYETLRRVRPRTTLDLSPHWQGQDIPPPAARLRVPFWSVAAVAGVVLAGIYITFRLLLGGASDSVAGEVRRLIPTDRVALARREPVPPPPPPPPSSQINCIKTALAAEIEAGRITAVETPSSVILRVGAFASFASGRADVLESFRPVATRMGTILDKHKGPLRIIGHSDNTPIASARFPSNWHLSVARAQAVAALIRPALSDPARVSVEGKGADQPLDDANTAEARARNRRVELIIPRDDAFQTCP
ncbi:type IVB secretion system protein IcmH/DotU [Rhabdaerophilum calidifontis]|uniref:type IVB secretion system protein IcmH/DotU n=1 Tax=Rhabdaerophilum calidifontis TaxID=2604328 RepID=UPI0012384844|nr:type IVB secretion system protein IcmH/DotU [Rhabdaerophilum calidifontis]